MRNQSFLTNIINYIDISKPQSSLALASTFRTGASSLSHHRCLISLNSRMNTTFHSHTAASSVKRREEWSWRSSKLIEIWWPGVHILLAIQCVFKCHKLLFQVMLSEKEFNHTVCLITNDLVESEGYHWNMDFVCLLCFLAVTGGRRQCVLQMWCFVVRVRQQISVVELWPRSPG